jgi:DNA-binding ferritin-like protein (Dps family)
VKLELTEKPSWLVILEKRIEELEDRLTSLEEQNKQNMRSVQDFLKKMSKITSLDSTILSEIIFLESYYSRVEDLDRVVDPMIQKERLKSLEQDIKPEGFSFFTLKSDWVIASIFAIAVTHNTRFEDVAAYLIDKLGKKKAKELVKKEDILRYYDKDCLQTWEYLIA